MPETLNYQGRMRLTSGAAVADSNTNNIEFRIYDDATAGTLLWSETQTGVTTTAGLFNVQLGTVNPLSVLSFNQPYWLTLRFNGDSEMSPRTPFTAGPYAFRAKVADSVSGPINLTATSPGAVILGSNGDSVGIGVQGSGSPGFSNSTGVLGQGGRGVVGRSDAGGGVGVQAEQGTGANALVVSGNARYDWGTTSFLAGTSVDFNPGSSVDFTGATVTGLALGGVPNPLYLSNSAGVPVIEAVQNGTADGIRGVNWSGFGYGVAAGGSGVGGGLYAIAVSPGGRAIVAEGVTTAISASAQNGSALVVRNNSSLSATVQALNDATPGTAIRAQSNGNGTAALWAGNTSFGGVGVRAEGGGSGGVGLLAEAGAGGTALRVSGSGLVDAAPGVTLTMGTYVSFTAGTNLSFAVSAPLSLTSPGQASTLYSENVDPAGVAIWAKANSVSEAVRIQQLGSGNGLYVTGGNISPNGTMVYGLRGGFGTTGTGVRGEVTTGGVAGSKGVLAINASPNTGTFALVAQSAGGVAVSATGAVLGVHAYPTGAGGIGVLAEQGAGALALKVSGSAQFSGGTVDFSGATVTGLPAPAPPVNWTANLTGDILTVSNSGSGKAINAWSASDVAVLGYSPSSAGVAASGDFGYGLYAQSNSNSAVYATSSASANAAIVGENGGGGAGVRGLSVGTANSQAGLVGQNTAAGGVAVYGSQYNGGVGVRGEAEDGVGVHGLAGGAPSGGIGVRASNTNSGGIGLLAEADLGPALRLSGTASIDSATNTITVASFVSFTAGTNLSLGVTAPLSLTLNTGSASPLHAFNSAGTAALVSSTSGSEPALRGQSTGNHGIEGISYGVGTWAGVRGRGLGDAAYGVVGEAEWPNGNAGVFGSAGTGYPSNVPGLAGVVGAADSVAGGVGVYGSGQAYGGVFYSPGIGLSVTAATGGTGLFVRLSGAGKGIQLVHGGTGSGAEISSNGTGMILSGGSMGLQVSAANNNGWGIMASANGVNGVGVRATTGPFSLAAVHAFSSNTPTALRAENVSGLGGPGIIASSTTKEGVLSSGAVGVSATGSTAGLYGRATGGTGSGVVAEQGAGQYALKVSGSANFSGGTVDFSGATVTGLSMGVAAPLSLTLNSASFSPLSVSNASGVAGIFQGLSGVVISANGLALSVTSQVAFSPVMMVRGSTFSHLAQFSNDSGGSGLAAYSSGGAGIFAQSSVGDGVQANSFGAGSSGVHGIAGVAGAYGVYAQNLNGGTGLYVTGGAQVYGSTTFTGQVDFSGATVTGLAIGLNPPVFWVAGIPSAVLTASNTGSGYGIYAHADNNAAISAFSANQAGVAATGVDGFGIYAQSTTNNALYATNSSGSKAAIQAENFGGGAGVSATSSTGIAVYGRNDGAGGFIPAAKFEVFGTNHAVQGRNLDSGAVGTLGGDLNNSVTGVYGRSATFSGYGVHGVSAVNQGVRGEGQVGVAGVVTATGQTGILADASGYPGSLAFRSLGDASFEGAGRSVSFATHVDFSGATVTGLAGGGLPLSGTVPMAHPGSVINVVNSGSGHGVFGAATQPGWGASNTTITAGVYGYSNVSLSVGVLGVNDAGNIEAAGVFAKGPMGIIAESSLSGGAGGEFKAQSGTAVIARGLTGVAAEGQGANSLALFARATNLAERAIRAEGSGFVLANSPNAAWTVSQTSGAFGAPGLLAYASASGTAAVRGINSNGEAPGMSTIPGVGVWGEGTVGVVAISSHPGGMGLYAESGSLSYSAAIRAEHKGYGTAVEVEANSGTAYYARGVTGLAAFSYDPAGVAVFAYGTSTGKALVVEGPSRFNNWGSSALTQFNGYVDFSGATVTGLSGGGGLVAPVYLSGTTAVPVLEAENHQSGSVGIRGINMTGAFNSAGVAGRVSETAMTSQAAVAGVMGNFFNPPFGGAGVYGDGAGAGYGVFGVNNTVERPSVFGRNDRNEDGAVAVAGQAYTFSGKRVVGVMGTVEDFISTPKPGTATAMYGWGGYQGSGVVGETQLMSAVAVKGQHRDNTSGGIGIQGASHAQASFGVGVLGVSALDFQRADQPETLQMSAGVLGISGRYGAYGVAAYVTDQAKAALFGEHRDGGLGLLAVGHGGIGALVHNHLTSNSQTSVGLAVTSTSQASFGTRVVGISVSAETAVGGHEAFGMQMKAKADFSAVGLSLTSETQGPVFNVGYGIVVHSNRTGILAKALDSFGNSPAGVAVIGEGYRVGLHGKAVWNGMMPGNYGGVGMLAESSYVALSAVAVPDMGSNSGLAFYAAGKQGAQISGDFPLNNQTVYGASISSYNRDFGGMGTHSVGVSVNARTDAPNSTAVGVSAHAKVNGGGTGNAVGLYGIADNGGGSGFAMGVVGQAPGGRGGHFEGLTGVAGQGPLGVFGKGMGPSDQGVVAENNSVGPFDSGAALRVKGPMRTDVQTTNGTVAAGNVSLNAPAGRVYWTDCACNLTGTYTVNNSYVTGQSIIQLTWHAFDIGTTPRAWVTHVPPGGGQFQITVAAGGLGFLGGGQAGFSFMVINP